MWFYISLAVGFALVLILVFVLAVWPRSHKSKKKDHTHLDIEDSYPPRPSSPKYISEEGYDRKLAKIHGDAVEEHVADRLNSVQQDCGGFIWNNFIFEDDDGFSAQIDHLYLTRAGLFVIETKGNKGEIAGDADDDWWVAYKNSGHTKTLRNPINQNEGHINHLWKLFHNKGPKMINMVIFVEARITSVKDDRVYNLQPAANHIREMNERPLYSDAQLLAYKDMIDDILETYGIDEERHQANLDKRFG